MIGLVWDIVDAVIDWRIERRRRLPVVAAPDLVRRCAERDPWMNRCVLAAGHAEQHKPSCGPWSEKPRCPARDNMGYQCTHKVGHTELHTASHGWGWTPQGRFGNHGCSVHCMPSCSYPKCVETPPEGWPV